jgi:hypothetical protein
MKGMRISGGAANQKSKTIYIYSGNHNSRESQKKNLFVYICYLGTRRRGCGFPVLTGRGFPTGLRCLRVLLSVPGRLFTHHTDIMQS